MKPLLLIVCALSMGCYAQKTASGKSSHPLDATWLLTEMNSEPGAGIFADSPKTPQLLLDTDVSRLYGNDGCNALFGTIETLKKRNWFSRNWVAPRWPATTWKDLRNLAKHWQTQKPT